MSSTKPVRVVGLLSMIAGVVLIVAGAATWVMVRTQLVDENITVADDAQMFGGELVDGPLDAYYQADIINTHALAASDGKTYAELEQDDPVRVTMMNASFLRSSLFTSVIAFGVAAFAAGMGLLFLLIGYALRALAPAGAQIVRPTGPAA
ncbi:MULTISPECIES: aromatic ring-opening dioxygenase LigA [unclassified Actinotalea]|uniref:aromatic ring-opening dioxygenase LigA n=1 Tax=unclassified Actinotalea TaxID=2638618 RepID=UPI0015F62101|nr:MULTISPECIES: aromatic ring-opening dioxygenase LigA [unclassified Actinotalea]